MSIQVMKTTRTWPIPRASIVAQDNEIFTIGYYGPSTDGRHNPTDIRLCSVDVWIQNLTSHSDLSIEIMAGIGNNRTVIRAAGTMSYHDPARLDLAQRELSPHSPTYAIQQGSVGFQNVGYVPDMLYGDPNSGVPITWERPVIGVVRNRRPLRFRWRKEERPYAHLWEQAVPTIWGRPHFSPASTHLEAEIMGFVTFEADQ